MRVGDPVDPGTGQFVLTKTEVVLRGPLPIVLQRTQRSGDPAVRPLGRGATHNYALFIRTNPGFQDGNLVLSDGGPWCHHRSHRSCDQGRESAPAGDPCFGW